MQAKILKRMNIAGKIVEPDTIVDVSSWRTATSLRDNRYIEFLPEEKEVKSKQEKVSIKE